jgi:hypothetical protein
MRTERREQLVYIQSYAARQIGSEIDVAGNESPESQSLARLVHQAAGRAAAEGHGRRPL